MGSYQRSSGKQKLSHVKAIWTAEIHEVFINLCLEQISIGNRPGTHLNRKGWNSVLNSFQTITGLNYDRGQLKNHWDSTRKWWKIWHKLIEADSMKWDPDTRCFGASEQDWDEYIQANPEAAQFRVKALQLADKLDIVFGGTPDSEQIETPICWKNNNQSNATEPTAHRTKHNSYAAEKDPPTHYRRHQPYPHNTFVPLEEPVITRPDSYIERCYDAVESRSVITVQSPPPKLSYSIEECIKCLDSVEELEQGSELYLFALDIFLKKEYREIFLNLKKSETRIAWLKRLQSTGPPLPLH